MTVPVQGPMTASLSVLRILYLTAKAGGDERKQYI